MTRFLILLIICTPCFAQKPLTPKKAYKTIDRMFSEKESTRKKATQKIIESRDESLLPALVEAVFFNTHGLKETVEALETMTGLKYGANYKAWISYIGSREDITPMPGYLKYKGRLYGMIDPKLEAFFDPKFKPTIRPVEILSGGVKKDGIPALMNPEFISAKQARFLKDDEKVFGVAINGDVRAYTHRVMDWHEMANDVVGGVPVSLSYCTLCGSGILFDTSKAKGGPYTFGSSGLLYRSNKLMYDHQTDTLWSNMTGEPVMGKLVGSGVTIDILPLTITTWGEWKALHPDTKVLSLNTGFSRDYRPGAAYGSYFASPDTMFPVWNAASSDERAKKDWMWVAVLNGKRNAWAVKDLQKPPFRMDTIGDAPVAIITNPSTGSVRVFDTSGQTLSFEKGALTVDGKKLRITEDALISEDKSIIFKRVPGHGAYWFSWSSFFPDLAR